MDGCLIKYWRFLSWKIIYGTNAISWSIFTFLIFSIAHSWAMPVILDFSESNWSEHSYNMIHFSSFQNFVSLLRFQNILHQKNKENNAHLLLPWTFYREEVKYHLKIVRYSSHYPDWVPTYKIARRINMFWYKFPWFWIHYFVVRKLF